MTWCLIVSCGKTSRTEHGCSEHVIKLKKEIEANVKKISLFILCALLR